MEIVDDKDIWDFTRTIATELQGGRTVKIIVIAGCDRTEVKEIDS
jgi:hypothetical protein